MQQLGYYARVSAIALMSFGIIHHSNAQNNSPPANDILATTLTTLISTFVGCRADQDFAILGPVVYQAVVTQTGGTGCYPTIQQLGPLKSLTRQSSMQLPAGPVVTYKAVHQNGVGIWQIGISQLSHKVEWLTFAPGTSPAPNDPSQGCLIYRDMC